MTGKKKSHNLCSKSWDLLRCPDASGPDCVSQEGKPCQ